MREEPTKPNGRKETLRTGKPHLSVSKSIAPLFLPLARPLTSILAKEIKLLEGSLFTRYPRDSKIFGLIEPESAGKFLKVQLNRIIR